MMREEDGVLEDDEAGLEVEGRPSKARRAVTIAVIVVLVLAALGGLTWMLGIGPFGYRLFTYGMVKVHIYNGTPHFAHVQIDGVDYRIMPFEGESVEMVGGELPVETTLQLVEENEEGVPEVTEKREPLESFTFTATENHLYHVATESSTCAAVVDMTSYYRKGEKKVLELVKPIPKDARLQPLDVSTLYFPQSVLPDALDEPPMWWMATVACSILEVEPVACTVCEADSACGEGERCEEGVCTAGGEVRPCEDCLAERGICDPEYERELKEQKMLIQLQARAESRRKAMEKRLDMIEKIQQMQRQELERQRERGLRSE